MALPSKLTSPLPTVGVDNPDVAAQANVDLTVQTIANAAAATLTVDPTKGSYIQASSTYAGGLTVALAASFSGTLQSGQRVTIALIQTNATISTLTAGANVILPTATITPVTAKTCILEFRYDGTNLRLVTFALLTA